MVQIVEHDLEVKITIKCYDQMEHGKGYLGSVADYAGMPFGISVSTNTIAECLTELGKRLESLEAYRKYQKK